MTVFTEQITFLHKHEGFFSPQKRCESGGDGRGDNLLCVHGRVLWGGRVLGHDWVAGEL